MVFVLALALSWLKNLSNNPARRCAAFILRVFKPFKAGKILPKIFINGQW